MRRISNGIIRAVALLSVMMSYASCNLEFEDVVHQEQNLNVGLYAGGAQTRTEMLSNGLSTAWVAGDELALWAVNSSGAYTLDKQVFKTYGIDAERGFFSATLPSAMAEDTYTYMCCYPVPASVNGTQATFILPSEQDGKVTGGADIMIADPLTGGSLTSIPDPDDHSTMAMTMNRMMHQFRFWMPSGTSTTGEDIEEIIVTMPQNIVGTVTADISDPDASMILADGANTMTMVLKEPIGESASVESATFACASVFPYDGTYSDTDYMNLVAYSQSYRMTMDPISLSGRTFASGHSTPVRILPTAVEKYYRLTLKIGDNFIGEVLDNVTISFDGTPWYTYTNTVGTYSNFNHVVEAYGDEGKEAYDLIVSSIEAGTATYTYETANALVDRPLTADMMTYDGNRIVLDLGDVPYLLYEDFTNALHTAHDDDYTPGLNSDTNLKGYLLNGYMPLDGWNAARFSILEGDCIRINCRYQSGSWVVGRYCGRLDTPALSYLKSGASVDLVVEFEEAFYVPAGYNRDDSQAGRAKYHVGYHTDSQSSAINGQNSNDVSGEATFVYTSEGHSTENVAYLNPASVTIPSAGPSTRVVWFVDTDRETSVIAANSVYYLYLDNIRIYIK